MSLRPLFAYLLLTVCLLGSRATAKPNILIFFIDDLGRADMGFDGSTFHETPRLDALAAKGIRFTDFYSAHAVCSPTRTALLTGKVPQRLGITDWIRPDSPIALPASETTLGEAFRAQGYATAYIGKWHVGSADQDQPVHHGFEWTRAVNRAGEPGSFHFPYRRNPDRAGPHDVPDLGSGQPGDYLTDVLTTEAIGYLRQRDPSRPFLLCFSHYAVHTPIQAPAALVEKYREKRRQRFGESATPTRDAPHGAKSRARQDDATYAAMMENLDTNIGRVLEALDELGLRENTIVIFTSDNGGFTTVGGGTRVGATSNLPWRSGKGWNYEGGIRIPFVIAWPGTLSPGVRQVPAFTGDLYPTLLELAGLPLLPEQHRDGVSLAGLLRGQAVPALQERALGWYYPHVHGSGHRPSAALRQGKWKLIQSLENQAVELYNLETDPFETTDLSAREPERVTALRAALTRWIETTTTRS